MSEFTLKKELREKLPITSITPFTLQDFPDKLACILWFSGCNFACGYCHNPELVKGSLPRLPFTTVDAFLKERKNFLDGVVLCGGECTISKSFAEFVRYLNELGYLVKLDTNGSSPEVLSELLNDKFLDYIALDYKAPHYKFKQVTSAPDKYLEKFVQSLELICNADVRTEVRTTVHTDLLNEDDINYIINHLAKLKFKGSYHIQNFIESETLGGLKAQKYRLNLEKIIVPKNFDIQYRNF